MGMGHGDEGDEGVRESQRNKQCPILRLRSVQVPYAPCPKRGIAKIQEIS
ncbi:hypothetical protein NSTC745_00791 [Nostoc sp. DSM 114161]|jgi:hypothetical protein